jgi:hypothetical protein
MLEKETDENDCGPEFFGGGKSHSDDIEVEGAIEI